MDDDTATLLLTQPKGLLKSNFKMCFFSTECIEYMDVSENSGFSPQIIPFVHRVSIISPSILGYPYFWKHPYIVPKS